MTHFADHSFSHRFQLVSLSVQGIAIPGCILVFFDAVPSMLYADLRKRILGYNTVAEYSGYFQAADVFTAVIMRIPAAILWQWSVEQNALRGADGAGPLLRVMS